FGREAFVFDLDRRLLRFPRDLVGVVDATGHDQGTDGDEHDQQSREGYDARAGTHRRSAPPAIGATMVSEPALGSKRVISFAPRCPPGNALKPFWRAMSKMRRAYFTSVGWAGSHS